MIILQIILLASSYILLCLPPEATVSSTYDPQCALLYLPKDTVLDDYTLNHLGISYDDIKDYELLEVIEREGPFTRYSIKAETQSDIVQRFSEKKNSKCIKTGLNFFYNRVSKYTLENMHDPRDEDIHELAAIANYLTGFYESLKENFLVEDIYFLFTVTASNLINNAVGVQIGNKQGLSWEYLNRFDTLVDYYNELRSYTSEEQSKDTLAFHYYFHKAILQPFKKTRFSSERKNRYLTGWYYREASKYASGDSHMILKEKAKDMGVV